MITKKAKCVFCHKFVEIKMPVDGYQKYLEGELVQRAFPNMKVEDREFLISGICKDCQKSIFGEDDDE